MVLITPIGIVLGIIIGATGFKVIDEYIKFRLNDVNHAVSETEEQDG